MHQNLLNAEIASGAYRNARDKNMPVFGVMKALTKVLHISADYKTDILWTVEKTSQCLVKI
jgi:hypothetical protein